MEEMSFQEYATTRKSGRFSKKALIVLVIVLILVGVGLIGSGLFAGKQEKKTVIAPTNTPAPTQQPTDTPAVSISPTSASGSKITPTTKPTGTTNNTIDKATGLDRAKLTIKILNGSGKAGAAKDIETFLTGLGYVSGGTDNADSFSYQNMVIQLKPSKNQYLPLLRKDLSSKYTMGSMSANLAPSSSSDAVVIIGVVQ